MVIYHITYLFSTCFAELYARAKKNNCLHIVCDAASPRIINLNELDLLGERPLLLLAAVYNPPHITAKLMCVAAQRIRGRYYMNAGKPVERKTTSASFRERNELEYIVSGLIQVRHGTMHNECQIGRAQQNTLTKVFQNQNVKYFLKEKGDMY